MLVVSSVIGVGIFVTPGAVAARLPDPSLFLLVWVVGGALSLAGALANAELGTLYPRAGGDYVYLREAFHPAAGFLVGWLSFFIIYTGTIATLATGFAESLAIFVPLGPAERIAVAVFVTLATSWVNHRGLRLGATFNTWTAWAKILTLAFFVIVGFAMTPTPPSAGVPLAASTPVLLGFTLALSPILFSFLGWNAPVFVGSEIHDPERTLPRALFVGLAICTGLYLVTNAVYLHAMPVDVLATQSSAGSAAAHSLFGPLGGSLTSGLILLSILGCLNASVLVGPRIGYAMAIDGLFFRGADKIHPEHGSPHIAIWIQAAGACLIILVLRSFPNILDYTTFAIVLATIADVAALYALRRRLPKRHRPYRAWGYPLVPAFYIVANLIIAAALLWARPFECAIALAVLASGLPFYRWFQRGTT
jgi:APA family basic amino acid/polyamine antiporter